MNSKQQGDLGVAAAILYYTKRGYIVSVPLTDNSRYDLVVDMDGALQRVQCKTTGFQRDSGSYVVALRMSGGNRSWQKAYKYISSSECEYVFVYTLAGTMYEFPVAIAESKASLSLGSKYTEYIVT